MSAYPQGMRWRTNHCKLLKAYRSRTRNGVANNGYLRSEAQQVRRVTLVVPAKNPFSCQCILVVRSSARPTPPVNNLCVSHRQKCHGRRSSAKFLAIDSSLKCRMCDGYRRRLSYNSRPQLFGLTYSRTRFRSFNPQLFRNLQEVHRSRPSVMTKIYGLHTSCYLRILQHYSDYSGELAEGLRVLRVVHKGEIHIVRKRL